MKTKKTNWATVTGLATVSATIISGFIFLFGEGILQRTTITPEPSQLTSNSVSTQTASITTGSILTSPIKISVSQTVSIRSSDATFTLNYIEVENSTVLLHVTIDNSNSSFNLLTCGLPKLTKSQYGEMITVQEKGGFYSRVGASCFLPDILIGMGIKEDGWLVYEIDRSRFRIKGLYSVDNLGEYFPVLTFEIKDEPQQ